MSALSCNLRGCYGCRLPSVSALYLHTRNPQWWQFITAAFCHYSWDHLSSNLFMLYTFGKIVEEEEGAGAVWLTYIVCALGEGSPCTRLPVEAPAKRLTKACRDCHIQLNFAQIRMQQARLPFHLPGCKAYCLCRCQHSILLL